VQKHTSHLIVDASKEAGGLASTDVTDEGFLFDVSRLCRVRRPRLSSHRSVVMSSSATTPTSTT
jgi:hypothetical protein